MLIVSVSDFLTTLLNMRYLRLTGIRTDASVRWSATERRTTWVTLEITNDSRAPISSGDFFHLIPAEHFF